MSLTYYKISIIVTGVTGLLRAFSLPRNTVNALSHLHYRHPVTAVTGLCARAHGKKISLTNIFIQIMNECIFPRVRENTRNTCNTRNNLCFYYIYYLFTRNNLVTNRYLPVTKY